MPNTQETFERLAESGEWPSRYDPSKPENYNFIARRESVRQLLVNEKFDTALDLGCGTGDYCELLSQVASEYIGVDYSPSMVRQATLTHKGSASRKPPVFREASAESLPFDDNSFDLVCAIGFIEYFADPVAAMREIVRVLKPSGVLVIQSFQEDLFRKAARVTGTNGLGRLVRRLVGRSRTGFSTDKPYSGRELDDLMRRFQLERTDHRYSNYHVLPRTLRRVVPRINNGLSEIVTRRASALFSPFAVNYVGRYKLLAKS